MKLFNILTILSIAICISSVMAGGLSNKCWWEKCQDETKAFSTYYNSQIAADQTKISSIIQTCVNNYNSDVRKECETDNGIDTYKSQDAFSNFYNCIDSCNTYHINKNSCRADNEYCSMCQKDPTCVTYATNALAVSDSTSDAKCPAATVSSCPDTLLAVAQDSCKSFGKNACKMEYIKANAKSDDPCWPCFSSMISSLIVMLTLLSVLFF